MSAIDKNAPKESGCGLDSFPDVKRAELETIIGKGPWPKLRGVALSGGGIRSASFCLGVLQALNQQKLIESFHYLSTVSGGGYIGATITWLRHRKMPEQLDAVANLLRTRGNYLDPSQRLSMISLMAVTLRTILIHLLVYGGLLTALLMMAAHLPLVGFSMFADLFGIEMFNAFILLAGLWAGVFLSLAILYAISTFTWRCYNATRRYKSRVKFQSLYGIMLAGIIGLLALGLMPAWHTLLAAKIGHGWAAVTAMIGLVGGLSSAVTKFQRFLGADDKAKWYDSPAVVAAAATAALYGVVMLAYLLAAFLGQFPHPVRAAGAMIVLCAVLGRITDLNLISLHRMYRDRLMEAFLPDEGAIRSTQWSYATEANLAQLSEMAGKPYPLINTNVIMVDSEDTKLRGRGGASYVLAPLYSGSDATRWFPTDELMEPASKKKEKDGLSLPTAVAISGAAVNANVGSDSQPSLLRDGAVSFLIALFGLQLGCWVRNPLAKGLKVANFLVPGLPALLGRVHHRKAQFHMLSDGGHFDNTGIYELVRREVDLIVAVDGSADPNYHFDDLIAVVEKVKADFGVTVEISGGTPLSTLKPDGDYVGFPGAKVAKRGWVEGTITYPHKKGRLLYVKSTLVPDLPSYVYGYQATNPTFPNQTTADQFFDELQFESYRATGYAIGHSLVSDPDVAMPAPNPAKEKV
jgi:hypothetical protein